MAAAFNWRNYRDNGFVGGANTIDVGSTGAIGANGTFTAGDILVATIVLRNAVLTPTPPAGWSQIGSTADNGTDSFSAWWKLAGGSETGSYTFTFSSSAGSPLWSLWDFTGCDSSPIDGTPVVANFNTGGGTGYTTTPDIVATGSGVLLMFADSPIAISLTPPGDMTTQVTAFQLSSNDWIFGSTRSYSAGNLNETTTGTSNFRAYLTLLVALKSATGGATLMGQICL